MAASTRYRKTCHGCNKNILKTESLTFVNSVNEFAIVSALIKFVCKIPMLARTLGLKARPHARATIGFLMYNDKIYDYNLLINPGATWNAFQKKKPDIICLGFIDMINTQTLMLIILMKFVKLKLYLMQ